MDDNQVKEKPPLERRAPFNPQEHMMNLRGKDYLPVNARIAWFRDESPIGDGWGILTEQTDGGHEQGFATFQATIVDPDGRSVAQGTATEHRGTGRDGFPKFLEKAETNAIGRALGLAGFGTLFALEFDEGEDVCDSPVGKDRRPAAKGSGGTVGPNCAKCGDPLTPGRMTMIKAKNLPNVCANCEKG